MPVSRRRSRCERWRISSSLPRSLYALCGGKRSVVSELVGRRGLVVAMTAHWPMSCAALVNAAAWSERLINLRATY